MQNGRRASSGTPSPLGSSSQPDTGRRPRLADYAEPWNGTDARASPSAAPRGAASASSASPASSSRPHSGASRSSDRCAACAEPPHAAGVSLDPAAAGAEHQLSSVSSFSMSRSCVHASGGARPVISLTGQMRVIVTIIWRHSFTSHVICTPGRNSASLKTWDTLIVLAMYCLHGAGGRRRRRRTRCSTSSCARRPRSPTSCSRTTCPLLRRHARPARCSNGRRAVGQWRARRRWCAHGYGDVADV